MVQVRSKNGEAISEKRRTPHARKKLRRFIRQCLKAGDLGGWRRGRAVLGYIEGRRVIELALEADVTRGSVNRWLQWYEAAVLTGLLTDKAPGPVCKLTQDQQDELGALVDAGPQAAQYTSGVWTGPMIKDLIQKRFQVHYHKQHIPRLLLYLGFSVQRPRKRLARADLKAQAAWVREKLPMIKKKPRRATES
jgi:transposase